MATPLSDDVTGGNVAARAPSSSALTVTFAPGTTAPDVSTTVTISRPSGADWARANNGAASAVSTSIATRTR